MGLDGAYVARVEDAKQTPLLVKIPQIFQSTSVPLDKWVGRRPTANEDGFVVFINGQPEWPVWIGSQLAQNVASTDVSISSGSGGGEEEVWVGASAPSGEGFDLWFDTDEEALGGDSLMMGMPAGGHPGDLLLKTGEDDYEADWSPNQVPPGGDPGQVLAVAPEEVEETTEWVDIPAASKEEFDQRGVQIDSADPTEFTHLLEGHVDLVGRLAAMDDDRDALEDEIAAAVAEAEEVAVQPDDPGAGFDLWFDPDATPIGSGEEVAVQPDDPGDGYDLWFDPDATPAPLVLPAQPKARVTQAVGIPVETTTSTKITFNNVEYDYGGLFDAVGQGFRIPVGGEGVYRFSITANFAGAAGSTWRWVRIFRNGSSFYGNDSTAPSSSTGEGTALNWSDDLFCTAGALYTMHVWQKSGVQILTRGTFSVHKVI